MNAYIKGELGEVLELEVIKRIYPNSIDESDRNFLKFHIKANIKEFDAQFSCNIRTDEIEVWTKDLDIFLTGNTNTFVMLNMEENIYINGVSDFLGHVKWMCKIRKDSEGDNPSLDFTIETSLNDARELLMQLKKILLKYPVL